MPINLIFEFQQLDGLSSSILSLIKYYDILYIIIPICTWYAFRKINKKSFNFSWRNHVIILLLSVTITSVPVFLILKKISNNRLNVAIETVFWNVNADPIKMYQAFGLLPITYYQLQDSPEIIELGQAEKDQITNIISQNNKQYLECLSQHDVTPKNIVIFLLESFNTACINPIVTPTIHSLCLESETLYCPNVKQMTQGAMSIGGQLITLTGLNGLRTSVYCADFPDNNYPSIARELKLIKNSANSFTVVSTSTHFWRQDMVNQTLGIDSLFGNSEINPQRKRGWADDKEVIDYAASKLKHAGQPFCAIIVPGNMHAPYTFNPDIKHDIKFNDVSDPALTEYLRRANYLDIQIDSFISSLKEVGLYENTLIVITSDHQVPGFGESIEMRNYLSEYIPAIFVNTGTNWSENNIANTSIVFSHGQVYPTMLQLLGLRPQYYSGLYPPMTNIDATSKYDFTNIEYNNSSSNLKQMYEIEENIIKSNYFKEFIQ